MNAFLPTLTLLAALKTRIEAVVFDNGENLFEKVEFYSEPDPVKALAELNVFKDRVCLIIPDNDTFEHSIEGRTLRSTCDRTVTLLLADRDAGRRQKAHTGDEGILAIKDALIAQLLGQNLNQAPRLPQLQIRVSQPFLLAGDDLKKQPGRVCWELDLQAYCGERIAPYHTSNP